ncbi:unnamed protein product [Rotaria sordida]|uniref:MULE transposase domain-containing protein n=1 Tax=Rotaria sordida TaxID=392033 RepID=A0A813ZEY1_9BILA|nr:unnamed protein product [Rotaria sordida]
MVVTRSQTSIAASTAPALKSSYQINKQPKSSMRSRPVTSKRPPSPSPSDPVHRTITRTRSSSSNSSSTSSTNSSRSLSSSSFTDSSCSSDSSTISSSSSDSDSPKSTTISSIIENMTKLEISSGNNFFSSISTFFSQQAKRLPQDGTVSVYKSTKGGDFICLRGYTYQIDRRMRNKIKWKCQQSRNKTRCGTKIYTTENMGTNEIPAYKYIESNNVQHSHDEDHDQQIISIFKSGLKSIGKNNRTLPSSKIINQLATDMKLSDTQLGMIPHRGTLSTPVLYALLNDKKAHTYTLLFRALKSAAKEMNMKFKPDRIISDFESGIVSTIKKELPNTIHQGCLFHLYQRLTKKMKKFNLWSYYKNNDALHLFIKKVMAIVLLKPTLIDNAYELLANQYLKLKQLKQFRVQLRKFMLYFHQQWMKLENRTMISFYEVDFKTNNWSESYNAVLKRRTQQNHLSIWTLIELLITEETAVRMKHFQLLNGKKKSINTTIRNNVIEINKKIFEFNQKFEDDEIELDECLTLISSLVGVKYDQWRTQLKKNKRRKKYDSGDDHDN